MSTRQQRIDAGVAYLDEHFPGWLEQINLDTMNVASLDDCPAGQAFALIESDQEKANYQSVLGFDRGHPNETFEGLTKAWAQTIRRLRRERAPKETPQ